MVWAISSAVRIRGLLLTLLELLRLRVKVFYAMLAWRGFSTANRPVLLADSPSSETIYCSVTIFEARNSSEGPPLFGDWSRWLAI